MSKADDRTNRKQREGEKDNGVREEFGYGDVVSKNLRTYKGLFIGL